ncbi:MAG TPA: phosphotransferase family protein, partial [Nitrolancea sp.]|nr:phosphotransferase family protein [Nitrolancea sp.]
MDDETFQRVVARLDPNARLVRASPLTGGISAQVIALEIEHAGGERQKIVLRRHGERDLAHNPRIAADEFRLLQMLQVAGIAAPAPLFLDEACDLFPTPYLLMEFIEGEADFSPDDPTELIAQMADQLARIHRIDAPRHDLSFLPHMTDQFARRLRNRPAALDDSLSEGRIRDALEPNWPPSPRNADVLLHGDYWPGNILWKDGALAAVIDWEDAARGDPLGDLANARLELLFFYGPDAPERFTERYLSASPIDTTNLPYWDLAVAHPP